MCLVASIVAGITSASDSSACERAARNCPCNASTSSPSAQEARRKEPPERKEPRLDSRRISGEEIDPRLNAGEAGSDAACWTACSARTASLFASRSWRAILAESACQRTIGESRAGERGGGGAGVVSEEGAGLVRFNRRLVNEEAVWPGVLRCQAMSMSSHVHVPCPFKVTRSCSSAAYFAASSRQVKPSQVKSSPVKSQPCQVKPYLLTLERRLFGRKLDRELSARSVGARLELLDGLRTRLAQLLGELGRQLAFLGERTRRLVGRRDRAPSLAIRAVLQRSQRLGTRLLDRERTEGPVRGPKDQ
jgi:hypothetical protein